MTANMFFRICEICYDANNYFNNQKKVLTPLEKYLEMADGRDAGLRNIDGDSPEAFYEWYHGAGKNWCTSVGNLPGRKFHAYFTLYFRSRKQMDYQSGGFKYRTSGRNRQNGCCAI